MNTKEIEKFYDDNLSVSDSSYESNRWKKTSQGRGSYKNTLAAITQYSLPYIPTSGCIFELGPGPGTWTKVLLQQAPNVSYDLVDISSEMLSQAKAALPPSADISLIHSDILDFVPTKQYDYFFSSRMIEYVPEKNIAVQRIAKAMKQGAQGFIITKTPQYSRPFSKRLSSPIHQLQITDEALVKLFVENGISVKKVVLVAAVFPGLRNGVLDRLLTIILSPLPFSVSRLLSESYGLVLLKE
jgi:SAM-dependent methyltransferase